MNDFEAHQLGTANELKLSRDLAREIEQTLKQFGRVIPNNVEQAYYRLREHYDLLTSEGMI